MTPVNLSAIRSALSPEGIKVQKGREIVPTLYVTDQLPDPDNTYYGKIVGGRFVPARDCPDEVVALVNIAIM